MIARAPSLFARGRRASWGSLTTTSSTPSARNAATDSDPIGPPPVTSHRVPGRAPPRGDAVQRDGQRLGERGVPHRQARRGCAAGRPRRPSCSGRTRPATRSRRYRPGCRSTHRNGRSAEAVLAPAATGGRPVDHGLADLPAGDAFARPRRCSRCTRGPRSHPAARPIRGGSGGRCRRSRSGSLRAGPRPGQLRAPAAPRR